MHKTRDQMEREEALTLAAYAQHDAASAGRRHPEGPHPYRTPFQRDRARVIHSRAFRRLEYKTQVFLNGTGDHLRTRLTHTIEVASVSRTIARALGLNEDLAEAIALAHDLGHPPFGHPGEHTLDRLMQGHGGFDHNAQSLRIVELIESTYPEFRGLNLSFEVTEGLRKHQTFYDPLPGRDEDGGYHCPTLEAQIANLADEITYNSHDLDDGLDSDLIRADQLGGIALWQETRGAVLAGYPALESRDLCATIIRRLIDRAGGGRGLDERRAHRGFRGKNGRRRAPPAQTAHRLQRRSARRQPRTEAFPLPESVLPPDGRRGQPPRLRASGRRVRRLPARPLPSGRGHRRPRRDRRPATHGLRLSLRHDRPLSIGGTRPAVW